MQPDQAKFLLEHYAEICCYELGITSRVIGAMPVGREDYAPDPKSKNALDLAWHIVSSECWFLDGLHKGAFGMDENPRPAGLVNGAQIVEWYKANAVPLWEKVKTLDGAKLAQPMDFFGVYNMPAVAYLSFMVRHSVHHRGQLAAYLRPMGGKVPDIYGGSADEPFQPPK
jgi:uncharacterized damage-inducible protein DinB